MFAICVGVNALSEHEVNALGKRDVTLEKVPIYYLGTHISTKTNQFGKITSEKVMLDFLYEDPVTGEIVSWDNYDVSSYYTKVMVGDKDEIHLFPVEPKAHHSTLYLTKETLSSLKL